MNGFKMSLGILTRKRRYNFCDCLDNSTNIHFIIIINRSSRRNRNIVYTSKFSSQPEMRLRNRGFNFNEGGLLVHPGNMGKPSAMHSNKHMRTANQGNLLFKGKRRKINGQPRNAGNLLDLFYQLLFIDDLSADSARRVPRMCTVVVANGQDDFPLNHWRGIDAISNKVDELIEGSHLVTATGQREFHQGTLIPGRYHPQIVNHN